MMLTGVKRGLVIAGLMALAACAGSGPIATASPQERDAIEAALMRDIQVLASDDFGGRKPGTLGEEKTVAYITEEWRKAGLVSGTNDPGSAWRAPVELVSTQPFTSRLAVIRGRRNRTFEEADAAAFTPRRRELIENGAAVFVGNEAESVPVEAVSGKIVVMLGEPGVSPQRRAMLFDRNPAAIITVVEDQTAIARVRQAFGRERIRLGSEPQGGLTAFVTRDSIADALGQETWRSLEKAAEDDDFTPISLREPITIEATSQRREFTSYNVLGLIPGSVRGSGAVLLMGHWDHLGECGDEGAQDTICNGAVDNASGIAVMLELARRLNAGGPHDRDIYFLATSAEESGLLGAVAFAKEPPIPLDTIVAAFNFDTVAIAPAGSAVGFVGEGETGIDQEILEALKDAGRELGNKDFANRFVRRQDGWALLQEGVPAVFLSTSFGSEVILTPYLSGNYHQPGDQIEMIELGGAIDDLLLHEELVRRFADTQAFMPASDK